MIGSNYLVFLINGSFFARQGTTSWINTKCHLLEGI